jgi:hypothetical protein
MFDRTELTNDRFGVWKCFFLKDVTGLIIIAHKIKNIFILSKNRQKYLEKTKGTVINRKSSEEKR